MWKKGVCVCACVCVYLFTTVRAHRPARHKAHKMMEVNKESDWF